VRGARYLSPHNTRTKTRQSSAYEAALRTVGAVRSVPYRAVVSRRPPRETGGRPTLCRAGRNSPGSIQQRGGRRESRVRAPGPWIPHSSATASTRHLCARLSAAGIGSSVRLNRQPFWVRAQGFLPCDPRRFTDAPVSAKRKGLARRSGACRYPNTSMHSSSGQALVPQ
jgi:hypothetical protein